MAAFDVAIVGAGIVGASVAMRLAPTHRVLLLEGEDRPGYHTTGRSAALFEEAYGPAPIRKLTRASRAFLESPPPGFAADALLQPRGCLFVAPHGRSAALDAALAAALPGSVREISPEQALERCPALDRAWIARVLEEPGSMDMDVAAIHQGYLRAAKAAGTALVCGARVSALARAGGAWQIDTSAGRFEAAHIVAAAGAWADEIGVLAGASPLGLVPKRRTAFVFEQPAYAATMANWPMVVDIDETFYFKPEAGLLLASPADETPSPPCDAQPEDIDVAECAARIEAASALRIARVKRKWAGLRSFVADKVPVLGPDSRAENFHWAAGVGGYGIMTSPAVGRIVAAGVCGQDLPDDILASGLRWPDFGARRLAG